MSNTSENEFDVQKSLRRLAVIFAEEELPTLRELLGPDWDTFHEQLQSLVARIESAPTEEEARMRVRQLLRLLSIYPDVEYALRTYLIATFPELRPVVRMLYPSELLMEDVDFRDAIELRRPAGPRSVPTPVGVEPMPPAAAEPELEPEPAPRYANVDLVDDKTTGRCDPARPLAMKTAYHLRIDIGPLRTESVVKNATEFPFPDYVLPETEEGHWLDVVVTSEEFNIEGKQYALFLPESGSSWVCGCERNGRHHCELEEREPYLYVPVTSPSTPGEATLRIGFYYENNLLESHLFTAQVGSEVPAGKTGYESEIDYSLTRALTNAARLPARTLNIMTNENANGSHRFVLVGRERVYHRSLSDKTVGDAMGAARKGLHDTHRRLIREAKIKKFPDGTEEVIAPAEYKNLLKTLDGVTNAKNRGEFIADLKKLAQMGSLLWEALFQGYPGSRRILRDRLLKERATIQICRSKNSDSPLLFPWALIYDIYLDSDPSKWHLCELLKDWKPGKPLADPEVKKCPYDDGENHRMDLICPFGFWGFKHILEQPPSMPEGRDLPLEITLSDGQPEMAVGLSLDLQKPQDHVKELKKQLSKMRIMAKASKDDILEMLGNTGLEFVYLFCHGRRGKLPGAAQRVPYLEVGKSEPVTTGDIMKWQDSVWPADHWQKTSPLVFINGCHTAELTPDALVSFVDRFIEANAGGVIGTEVTVSQDLASETALLFFSYLLEKDGTVGQAIRRMRFDFLFRGNLMGLAYTPYCSANLHLE